MATAESGPVARTMSVSMMPGSRALTVIPSVPTSWAARLDQPVHGVLAGDVAGNPRLAELALHRRRHQDASGLRGIMCCSARRIPQKTWLRFQSTSKFHSSSDIWATGAVFFTPPELRTMMSSWP